MNLDNVTAELRPRSAWEAADFGVRLVRRDAAAIYRAWFATSLPLLCLALAIVYLTPWAGFAILFYWWLEPILDGPILDVIARRLFGGEADVAATVRAAPRMAWRNRLFWLTPWRLHFARSTAMPLTQLEQLSGAARRKRAKVLSSSVLNHGIGVTAVYQHLVIVVYLGVVLTVFMFVPAEYQSFDSFETLGWIWDSDSRHAEAANLLLFYLAQSLLEPWFVGAGFGLYVNTRTRLEAWDIEVAFRRMVARRQPVATTAGVLVVALGIAVAGTLAVPAEVRAEEPATETDPGFAGFWSSEEFADELTTVMAADDFRQTEIEERWVRKDSPEPGTADVDDYRWLTDFLEQLGLFISLLAEFGLWIIVALLVLLLYLKRDAWLPYVMIEPARRSDRPRVVLSTGEVTAAALPDDIPAAVSALWQGGQQREALSLLYRGSVFALVQQHGLRLPESATEGSCIAAVDGQASPEQSAYFRRVVNAWIRLAYGRRLPSNETVAALIESWPSQVGGEA